MAASMAPAILIAQKPYHLSPKTYPQRTPIGSSTKRSVTIASSSPSFRNGSPPETECPVPWDQQPVNEYQALSSSFPFSLASANLRDYCIRLSFLGSSFAILVGLPVATFGNSDVTNTSAVALSCGLGAASSGILFVMLVVLRMYLGWAYVGNRLLSATVDYEETGWYDGQVKPVLTKVKFTLIGLAISLAVCVIILVDVENPKYIPVNTKGKVIAGVYNEEAARSFEPDAFCGDSDLS
ncbi:protein CONSERVED IN THE GREEN LINEAGE AND DIATOMS 27, chloroplastic isoform X3 [Dendrobium catenatum]|uniref:protein CONSERVED IN THE GREEN LINEAGE AND DIATOMS 27, chloroplastic isoform X3 n=1 Tax=Dendrobium catenatum TaxID=906689 RepID=UPI0009F40D09|nr:protein CONSERVED IN THE GREEN LINEAGE AND DIATOMS 27, chloroplastic isoform X3 [Dendrobium catenatum]